jgi:hypothetical protein
MKEFCFFSSERDLLPSDTWQQDGATRVFAGVRDAETAFAGGMEGFLRQGRSWKGSARLFIAVPG